MASKKVKKPVKSKTPKTSSSVTPTPQKPQNAPVKKKKKNDPLRPQPAWLFPPDEENPILNPKNKSKEEIQKEIDERLAAIRFLEHKSVTAPVKTAPPIELLQLIGAFFASYGFISTGRIFSLERNARKKLEGWNDEIGEKKFPKDMPDLVKIFKDWRADWEGDSEAETSSSGSDSEEDVKMGDAGDDSDSSGSDSDDESEEEKQTAPKTNGVKIRTKLTDSTTTKAKKTFGSAPSPSESSESDSDSADDAEDSKAPAAVALPESSSSSSESDSDSSEDDTAAKSSSKETKAARDSESSSSSDSESESDSPSESEKKPAKKQLSDKNIITKTATTVQAPRAGSDSSETLKGNSPTKQLSPSVSSDSSSSDSSSSASSSSDSETEVVKVPPKSKSDSKSDSKTKKRQASSSLAAAATENATTQPAPEEDTEITPQSESNKRAKFSNEPFSRIPKDTKVDPRLASNKYVPYDYAERAHQDLIVTKGKGFTKEKNKKKRGSYRGGKIDTDGGKAIKFDD